MKLLYLYILVGLLAVINLGIFVKSKHFTYVKQVSYNEMYPTISAVPVKGVTNVNDSTLQINIDYVGKDSIQWQSFLNGVLVKNQLAKDPMIALKEGVNNYTLLAPVLHDSITATIENKKITKGFATAIYKLNAGTKRIDQILSDPPELKEISPEQLKAVRSLVTDSLGIKNESSEEEKVTLISVFLHKKIFNSVGDPTEKTNNENPYEQYIAASNGAKINCGIYATSFKIFASCAGIICRSVELSNVYKSAQVHVFNEYFSTEKKQWIATDIMLNNVCFKNAAGIYLNAIDIKNTDRKDSTVSVVKVVEDSLNAITFANLPKGNLDFYGHEAEAVFYNMEYVKKENKMLQRAYDYLWPNSKYLFYSDNKVVSNARFYLKQFLFAAFCIFGLLSILLSFSKRNKASGANKIYN